jgi:WD40 repeat protein
MITSRISIFLPLLLLFPLGSWAKLEIAELKRDKPVDFQEEILPILRTNCLACHNRTRSKGEVIMETPDDIRKGNDGGPFVEAGNAEDSFLFQIAAHTEDPIMPPAKNKVDAKNLTPGELGLLKLWIEQGAKGTLRARLPVAWRQYQRPNPPIYASAIDSVGRFAAAGRGNRIHLYDLASGEKEAFNLADPSLAKFGFYGKEDAAHLDVVNSLAFSPDGKILASGGYRTIKLWKRSPVVSKQGVKIPVSFDAGLKVSQGKSLVASFGEGNGSVLWSLPEWKKVREIGKEMGLVNAVAFDQKAERIVLGGKNGQVVLYGISDGKRLLEGNSTNKTPVTALAFSGGEIPSLVVARESKMIEAWPTPPVEDSADWKPLRELKGHSSVIRHLAFHPKDQNVFFSGADDSTVRAWKFKEGSAIKSMSVGTPVKRFALSPDGAHFAVSGTLPGGSLWDYATGKKVADAKGIPENVLSSGQKDRELAFARLEQTYYKAELKKREDEKKKIEARQKTVEKSLKDAEAKPIAEKKKAMDKALVERDEAKKGLAKQEETLPGLEKRVPEEDALTKNRTEELKKRTTALAEPEKKEKLALGEIVRLEKVLKQKEAVLAPAFQKIEQNDQQAKLLKAQLAEVEKTIKQSAGMPEQLKQANQKKTGLVAKLKPLQEQRVGLDKQAGDFRKQVAESQKSVEQAKAKSALAQKEADRLRKEKKETEDSLAQAKTKLTETQKELADLKKVLTAGKADLKKKEDALVKAEKEYQALENPRLQFVRDLERAKEDLVKAEAKIKEYLASSKRADEQFKKSEELSKQAKEEVAQAAKRILASIVFSGDGKTLVTLDQDGLVNLWSVGNQGKWLESYQVSGKLGRLFGRVDQKLGFVDQDGISSVIDLKREWTLDRVIGGDLAQTPIVHRVTALAFSPDGKLLASGGGDPSRTGEIIVWDMAKKSMLKHFPDIHSDMVNSVEFSRDGKLLVSGGADKFARVTDRETGKQLHAFEGHTSLVLGASLQANGRVLASVGADGEIKVWNLVNGDRAGKQAGYKKEITSIRFLGLTDQAFVTTAESKARILRVPMGNPSNVRELAGAVDVLHTGSVSAGGGLVAAGGESGIFRIWKVSDGKLFESFDPPAKEEVAKLAE